MRGADVGGVLLLDRVNNLGMALKDMKLIVRTLKEEVLREDNKYDLMIAARDFSCELPDRDGEERRAFRFDELPDGMVYAYHFIWCLYAIVWGIQQWDAQLVVAA